jgi:hypothetical protein
METQLDYETEPILAIFQSPEQASAAIEALHATGIPERAIGQVSVDPGRYQAEDGSLGEEGDGLWKGAAVGAPVGALFGIALAVSVPSPGPGVVAGLAVAGAAGCGILGGLMGAIARARFDDDEAEWIEVLEEQGFQLVVVFSRRPRRARETLRKAGAKGFLDTTTPMAAEVLRTSGARPGPAVPHAAAVEEEPVQRHASARAADP